MRTRKMLLVMAAATGLFITGAAAQHEGHTQGQAAPEADKADAGKMGGMMQQMMMKDQAATSKLVDQLVQGFAAIEAEKDPAVLTQKLAEHGALLKELQVKVQAHSQMMEMMQHMMGGDHQK